MQEICIFDKTSSNYSPLKNVVRTDHILRLSISKTLL